MRRSENLVARYLARLEQEAAELCKAFPAQLETIYFGGGTPSHLTDAELAQLVGALRDTWGFPAARETTLEADPQTFDKARLETFRALGFDRLSIGLQSTQDEVLSFLGRAHSGAEGMAAVEMALAAGFEVTADLITGITGQDTEADLRTLAETGVAHMSVYSLTVEPYTPFALRGVKVDEAKESADFELAEKVLSEYGLVRYEVSSHAQPGHESKHNQAYWRGDYFLHLGPSAAGFVPSAEAELVGERRSNAPIKSWLECTAPETDPISPQAYALDVLLSGLRTRAGVDLGLLKKRSGFDLLKAYGELVDELARHGLLELSGTHLRTTGMGLQQLNGIVRRFWNA